MARIPETAVKWINDKLKTKPNRSNYVGAVCKVSELDTEIRQCPYCHKIFLNPSFAVKHTLKRHPDQLLLLHKKALDTTKTDMDNSQTVLVNYLKSEFSNIKMDLEVVKKVVAHHSNIRGCHPATCSFNVQECKGAGDCPDIHIVGSLGEKSLQTELEHIVAKEDFIKLQAKVEEIFQMHKQVLLAKEDKKVCPNEDSLYKRLKKELLAEFEHMFNRFQRNNNYNEHFSRLTKDLQRLEEAVESNSKKIDSPVALKEIDKKIELQIENFYSNYGVLDRRHKTTVKCSKRVLSDNSSNVHRLNRRKKNIYTCNPQEFGFQKGQQNTHLSSNDVYLSAGSLKTSGNVRSPLILKDNTENIEKLGIDKAKVFFQEKLRDLNISPKAKQMPTEEYETKMQLLMAQKELFCQRYSNYKQIYEKVDSQANKLVKSKMKMRKQIRFSESPALKSSKSNSKLLVEASSPVEQKKGHNLMPQFEPMPDFYAAGDCGEAIVDCDYHANVTSLVRSNYASNMSSERYEEVGFTKNFEPSAKIVPLSKVLSEHKPIDIPDKSLSPIPSVEEFSELSSLCSDSNLSQTECEQL